MKRAFILGCILALAGGCARFSTKQTDYSYDENGKAQRKIITRATGYTLFSAKSSLANWKASQTDKSQGASVGSLIQESSDTNLVAVLEAIAKIVVAVK